MQQVRVLRRLLAPRGRKALGRGAPRLIDPAHIGKQRQPAFAGRRCFYQMVSQSFVPRTARNKFESVFCRDMRVAENTLRGVENGEAPPAAETASRFRGSGTIGAPERVRES